MMRWVGCWRNRVRHAGCKDSVADAPRKPHLPLDFPSRPALRSRAMQNAQNLMSSFEFIAALMSIIIGLGVTNLLSGAGRAFYRRKENPLDEVHLVLTIATLVMLVWALVVRRYLVGNAMTP